jgi:hypothetical protein
MNISVQKGRPGDHPSPSGSWTRSRGPEETEWYGDQDGRDPFCNGSLFTCRHIALLARFALEVGLPDGVSTACTFLMYHSATEGQSRAFCMFNFHN